MVEVAGIATAPVFTRSARILACPAALVIHRLHDQNAPTTAEGAPLRPALGLLNFTRRAQL